MPTFRSPNVHDTARGALVIDSAAATRGVVRLQPTVGLAQLLNNIQHDANLQGTEEVNYCVGLLFLIIKFENKYYLVHA